MANQEHRRRFKSEKARKYALAKRITLLALGLALAIAAVIGLNNLKNKFFATPEDDGKILPNVFVAGIDIALLRAEARRCGIEDIRQKAGDVLFAFTELNFEVMTALCSENSYKNRVSFVATAKKPTLRLKLATGSDSLKQSKNFISKYQSLLNL